ncbi:MAG TPA: DAHL domain-containing protein, partial [Planctomycetota bacterium]|nr:DAHL domain-containing protein [Planctomycetota bacterium]
MSLRIVLAASAVVALTAFLYVKTQTVDLERHEEVRQALGELTEISARLSEDVLKLRCSLLTNYDSVANSQRRFVGTLERLRTMYTNPSSPQETEILEGIAACRKALVEKGDLAEEFKSQSAVLENSLDYLPILGFSLSTKETGNAEVLRIVDDLVRDTLAYNRNAQKELLSRIGESIQRLGDLHSSLGAEHLRQEEFLIAHVQNVLRTKPIVDGLLGRIASVPVAERIEQLRGSVAWDYDQGVRSASWYRRLLLVLSGALLVAITVVLAKLQQKARLLAGANRDLEASVLDVARKEAETRAILEGAADGILSLDDQGLVRSMNPTAERLFGHPGGAALGRPFESLVSSGWETLKTRLGLKQETLGKNKDGTFVSLELVLTGIDVGDRKVFIALLQDITERKRVDSLKDEFVSTVSHELRTPLTSIRGSLGLISHGVIGVLPPTVKGMLDIAVKNCDRLVGLVNDILDVEKIASGKMVLQMRAFELGPLLAQAVEVNRPFADACGVKLELEVPERTHVATGDTDRLMQVLTNLVSNACKFSPRGETVRLRVSPAGARVRVSVSDRGPGIPEEFRPRMFQKFAQAGAGDGAAKKGTGLGLAISKAFIEKMGGTIGFTTETGKGTTFHFELDERKTDAAAAPPDLREPRVLICEDEPNIAS